VSLPEYERPPVHEVVLGVHFKAIERFGGPYIGLLWQEFRSQFGKIQEQSPLSFRLERFGLPEPHESPRIELLDTLPPRIWFVNGSETELLQVQQDWFSHNWRKIKEDDEYPRYAGIRASFAAEVTKLKTFLEREQLGALEPLQCEVLYINHIPLDNGETLGDLLTVFKPDFSDEFLKNPENTTLALRFLIPDSNSPIGRLHIAAVPVVTLKTQAPGIQLTITARCRSASDDIEAILSLLDMGHEWIVRGFTSITTTKMHEKWRRTQ